MFFCFFWLDLKTKSLAILPKMQTWLPVDITDPQQLILHHNFLPFNILPSIMIILGSAQTVGISTWNFVSSKQIESMFGLNSIPLNFIYIKCFTAETEDNRTNEKRQKAATLMAEMKMMFGRRQSVLTGLSSLPNRGVWDWS